MKKKIKSTYEEYVESLTESEREQFEKGFKDFALSELLLAIMEEDELSVRKLAKLAGVSPTVVQAMRSGAEKDYSLHTFFKILRGLGCKRLIAQFNNQNISLDIHNS